MPKRGVFALKTKYLTLSALRNGLSPGASFQWLADQLGDTGDQFLTGVIIEVDTSAGRLRYAIAGHPLILVSDGRSMATLGPTGPLVGRWTDSRPIFRPRGSFAIYSDGLIEAQDAHGTQFGVERLMALLVAEQNGGDPEAVADSCMSELGGLQGGHDPDDITLVVVGCSSRPHDSVRGDLHAELSRHPGVQENGTVRCPPPARLTPETRAGGAPPAGPAGGRSPECQARAR